MDLKNLQNALNVLAVSCAKVESEFISLLQNNDDEIIIPKSIYSYIYIGSIRYKLRGLYYDRLRNWVQLLIVDYEGGVSLQRLTPELYVDVKCILARIK